MTLRTRDQAENKIKLTAVIHNFPQLLKSFAETLKSLSNYALNNNPMNFIQSCRVHFGGNRSQSREII